MNPFSQIAYPGQALSALQRPQSVTLRSGAVWPIPNGVFLVRPAGQTALQYKDYYSGLWRTFESGPVNHPIPLYSDGTNFRAINVSGTIQGTNVTTPGTVYTQAGTSVSFAAPVAGGITATGTPIIGGSLSLALTTAGAGYTNPQIIIPSPDQYGGTPGLCLPAVAHVGLSAGALSGITVDFAGAGYLSAPPVTVLDPTGSGAVITATITNGTPSNGGLTGIIMNNNGALYDGTHIPAVTITGPTGSSGTAAATALPSLALTSVTVGSTNTGYTATIIFLSSLGASASPPLNIYCDPVLPRPACGTIAQSGGVLGTATIEDNGNGFQTVPLIKQVGNATADGSVNATFTAVVGGVNNILQYWQIG
jgi:hypothetical protein